MHIFRTPLRGFLKKLLLFSVFFLLGNVVLFGNFSGTSQVVAATAPDELVAELINMDTIGQVLIKVSNLLLRPLLAICGWAMDNSMVYGSVFGFDSALWTLRNLTKNLANFFLAFLFIYTILKSLFSGNNKIGSEFKTLITNTLIAGILIQASWFLTSAAVDLSTIATYGVGGLPITILGSSSDEKLNNMTYFNYEYIFDFKNANPNSDSSNFIILHTKNWNISPCATIPYSRTEQTSDSTTDNDKTKQLIIGRKIIAYQSSLNGNGWTGTQAGLCHHYGKIYRFNEGYIGSLPETIDAKGQAQRSSLLQTVSPAIKDMEPNELSRFIKQGSLLFTLDGSDNPQKEGFEYTKPEDKNLGGDPTNQHIIENEQALRLQDLFGNSQSYVGVMTTMFSSLLNLQENSLTPDRKDIETNTFVSCLNTLLNVFYIFVLLTPMLALAVVLVARIMILWIFIAISPIWIVLVVFNKEGVLGKFKDYFSKQEVVGILFAPVLITFAVSLSTVFIFLILSINLEEFAVAGANNSRVNNILDLFHFSIQGVEIKFAKIIGSLMGVAVVRALLFRAIKATKIGKDVGGRLQSFVEDTLKHTPFIPLPGSGGHSASYNMIAGNNTIWERAESTRRSNRKKNELRGIANSPLASLFSTELKPILKEDQETALNNNDFNPNDFVKEFVNRGINAAYTVKTTINGVPQDVTFSFKDFAEYADNKSIQTAITSILNQETLPTGTKSDRIFTTTLQGYFKKRYESVHSKDDLQTLLDEDKKAGTHTWEKFRDHKRTFDKSSYKIQKVGENDVQIVLSS